MGKEKRGGFKPAVGADPVGFAAGAIGGRGRGTGRGWGLGRGTQDGERLAGERVSIPRLQLEQAAVPQGTPAKAQCGNHPACR